MLDRATRKEPSDEERAAAAALAEELGYLPLALEQAAAYVASRQVRYKSYLTSYREHQLDQLERAAPETGDYEASIATTWSLTFDKIEAESPASADLLRSISLLAPDAIPLELFEKDRSKVDNWLAGDGVGEILEPLLRYSLIERNIEDRTVSIHRVVQAAVRAKVKNQGKLVLQIILGLRQRLPFVDFGNFWLWERFYPQTLAISGLIRTCSIRHAEAGYLMKDAAWYSYYRRRYEDAELFCQRGLAILERIRGPTARQSVKTLLYNLATLYSDTWGRYSEAESLFKRALLATSKKDRGFEHLGIVPVLRGLARLYSAQGRYAEAKPLFERALAVTERVIPSEPYQIARALEDLGEFHLNQGRHNEAEPFFKSCLAILENRYGSGHGILVTTQERLAKLYCEQGRHEESEQLFNRCLAILENRHGVEHHSLATTLEGLGELYRKQGRHKESEQLFNRCLAILENRHGIEHRSLATALEGLGKLYCEQGRHEESEQLFKSCLAILENRYGIKHRSLMNVLKGLGELYRKQGRHEESEQLFNRCLAIRRQGKLDSDTGEIAMPTNGGRFWLPLFLAGLGIAVTVAVVAGLLSL